MFYPLSAFATLGKSEEKRRCEEDGGLGAGMVYIYIYNHIYLSDDLTIDAV